MQFSKLFFISAILLSLSAFAAPAHGSGGGKNGGQNRNVASKTLGQGGPTPTSANEATKPQESNEPQESNDTNETKGSDETNEGNEANDNEANDAETNDDGADQSGANGG